MSGTSEYELSELEIDLSVYPKKIETPSNLMVIGDLHANPMKALWILAHYGILKLKNPKEDWPRLWEIYQTPVGDLNPSILDEYLGILMVAKLMENKHQGILFLGDMLADRGENDIYILLLLAVLKQGIDYQILISNHDWEAVVEFEDPLKYLYGMTKMRPGLNRSMVNRLALEGRVPGMRDFTEQLYNKYYKPFLKLYAYSMPRSQINFVYSHAPILRELVEVDALKYLEHSPENFSEMMVLIDKVNRYFQHYLMSSHIFDWKDMIWNSVWNRSYTEDTMRLLDHLKILNVHGHDSPAKSFRHFLSLDSRLGKPGIDEGILSIFQTDAKLKPMPLQSKGMRTTPLGFLTAEPQEDAAPRPRKLRPSKP